MEKGYGIRNGFFSQEKYWDIVELPEGRSVIGCKWVFKLKIKVGGIIERYKAKMVAKGYFQVEGIYFH